MLPAPGELLHFSEDPTIERFVPHVAATALQVDAYVWTVDALNAPSYWFPRQCPRVCSWGEGVARVHAIEPVWLEAMRTTALWAYRFAAEDFEPFGDPPHAFVATQPLTPLGPPVPVGDLAEVHAAHGIELSVQQDLEAYFAGVREQGLTFSGIRIGNVGVGPAGSFATRR